MGSQLIGIDVGGTKIAAATMRDGVLTHLTTTPTDTSSTAALLDQLASVIAAAGPAAAVGLAVPSVVDVARGYVRTSVNLPLADVAIADLMRQRVGCPVYIHNDASCAALAEAYDEDGALVADSVVMFTVGTGVGGGIVLGGRIFGGATGAAGEFGHMLVSATTSPSVPEATPTFPQPGSLENNAAGRTLDALGTKLGLGDGPAVVARANAGDVAAIGVLELLGHRLGLGIASVINALDPELVVIGGGVSTAGAMLLAPALHTARAHTLTGVGTKTEIRLARYGPAAGVRGAAQYAGTRLAAAHDPTPTP